MAFYTYAETNGNTTVTKDGDDEGASVEFYVATMVHQPSGKVQVRWTPYDKAGETYPGPISALRSIVENG